MFGLPDDLVVMSIAPVKKRPAPALEEMIHLNDDIESGVIRVDDLVKECLGGTDPDEVADIHAELGEIRGPLIDLGNRLRRLSAMGRMSVDADL
jgi:hypothetical protein